MEDPVSAVQSAQSDNVAGSDAGKPYVMPDEDIKEIVPFSMDVVRAIGRGITTQTDSGDEEVPKLMNDEEAELLSWIGVYCLPSIMSMQHFKEMVNTNKGLMSWGAGDDLAFGILALENCLNKWMAIARIEYKNGKSLNKHEIKNRRLVCKWNSGNGLSGKQAQMRYSELRNYISQLMKNDEAKTKLEEKFVELYDETEDCNKEKDSAVGSERRRRLQCDEMDDDLDEGATLLEMDNMTMPGLKMQDKIAV